MKKTSTYDDRQDHIRGLKLPEIETWTNEYPDWNYVIESVISEFTCICPKTGLPDFATITIRYVPDKRCMELKSFKEYILAYRNLGIFHEHVVNKLRDDFVQWVAPRRLEIHGAFNNRGGIVTSVDTRYENPKWKK
ncbi:MAG: preQ(1) synthase [Patescibacteria group bacterium]